MRVLMITFLWRLLVTRQWVTLLVKITKLQKYENENKILHGNSRYAFPHGVCFFSFFSNVLATTCVIYYLMYTVYCSCLSFLKRMHHICYIHKPHLNRYQTKPSKLFDDDQ